MNKKNFLLCVLIIFAANVDVFAQTRYHDPTYGYFKSKKTVSFGLKAGGQISAVNKIHSNSEMRFPGLVVGATVQIPLQNSTNCRLFLTPELLYSQEGEKNNNIDGSIKQQFFQDYLAHVILLKGYFGNNNLLFAELGSKLSYMINHKNKEIDLGELNKYDFGLCLGGGINPGRNDNFEIGARLCLGLIDIYPGVNAKNNNISGVVIFTYLFGI